MEGEGVFLLKVFLVFFTIACLGVVTLNHLNKIACEEKWANSGFPSTYGILKGCMISTDGETWIPSNNYRELQ